jgi:hypothetical protein
LRLGESWLIRPTTEASVYNTKELLAGTTTMEINKKKNNKFKMSQKRRFGFSYWNYRTGLGYPYGLARSKCGAFDNGTTNCNGVYRNFNLSLSLENKTG